MSLALMSSGPSFELQRLRKLEKHVQAMFRQAKREGCVIGMGYDHRIPADQLEGPMVKKLRKLANVRDGK